MSKFPIKRRCHRHNYCTKMSLPRHSKCSYRTGRDRITHIFTIPLISTNHVNRSKCNGIEVHIRRVINSVPNFIECNDVFDARIISLKHQYSVEGVAKTIGPRQANLVLIAYASSEGSGEPAHPRSLARTFAARSYKQ